MKYSSQRNYRKFMAKLRRLVPFYEIPGILLMPSGKLTLKG